MGVKGEADVSSSRIDQHLDERRCDIVSVRAVLCEVLCMNRCKILWRCTIGDIGLRKRCDALPIDSLSGA
jgi:hypothetical protein